MQIKKINDDKLKIILSSSDLSEKNVDVDSFLANPIESQNLFFEILDLAEEKYNFDIEDNKAVIEAISLDNNVFILTITKLSSNFDISNSKTRIYYLEDINDLINLYSFVNKNNISIPKIEIYKLIDKYYIVLNEENIAFENILLEFSNLQIKPSYILDIFKEYAIKLEQKRTLITLLLFKTFLSPRICSRAKFALQISVQSIYIIGSSENFGTI